VGGAELYFHAFPSIDDRRLGGGFRMGDIRSRSTARTHPTTAFAGDCATTSGTPSASPTRWRKRSALPISAGFFMVTALPISPRSLSCRARRGTRQSRPPRRAPTGAPDAPGATHDESSGSESLANKWSRTRGVSPATGAYTADRRGVRKEYPFARGGSGPAGVHCSSRSSDNGDARAQGAFESQVRVTVQPNHTRYAMQRSLCAANRSALSREHSFRGPGTSRVFARSRVRAFACRMSVSRCRKSRVDT
jgi:hypothetical protein